MFDNSTTPHLSLHCCDKTGVNVAVPMLPMVFAESDSKMISARNKTIARLIKGLFRDEQITHYISWFYTPMALEYCPGVEPAVTIYDCMDELSLFKGAPPTLHSNEKELFRRSDVVFTGGVSLFEAKRRQHTHVYPFPSSVDAAHFLKARGLADLAADQNYLARPRLGFAGVIDERIDLDLIREMAEQRPEWQIIMLGPVVKIDEGALPRMANIHWLGKKEYSELPKYFAGWDVAIMPFAINDATRYISPTKTPEFLAAGLQVVSTAIRDVVRPYGEMGLARIANDATEFVSAVEQALTQGTCLKVRQRTDAYLRTLSWEDTWTRMDDLIEGTIASKLDAATVLETPLAARAEAASY